MISIEGLSNQPLFSFLCFMELQQYDAVIFDLGGVIINLDYQKTIDSFSSLGISDFDLLYSQAAQSNLFDRYETGMVSTFHFINRLLDLMPEGCTPNQVVHAWNAMILNIPKERLDFLLQIKSKIPTYLYSNTNDLHLSQVRRELTKVSDIPLEAYFEKVYLSQNIGERKPNPEGFSRIIKENNLVPERTLFIDDTLQHIEGANKVGLATFHLQGELLNHVTFS